MLSIKDNELPEATTFKVQKYLETEPKVFAREPQEMVDKIVEGVRDILEDAAVAKAQGALLPSLEQERERHEAAVAQRAEEQKQEEERKRLEETKEEERVIAEMLQQQLDRQRQKHRESKHAKRPNIGEELTPTMSADNPPDRVDFDQVCNAIDKTGNVLSFRSVVGKSDPRQGPVAVV
jgi:eukaryotic translation initiation factor 2-alpha kinase 4